MRIPIQLAMATLIATTASQVGAAGVETHEGLCSILAGNSLTVQNCRIEVSANAFSATYVLVWPDGGKTTIRLSDEGDTVNEQPAREVPVPADIEAGSECFETGATRDIYCSKIAGTQ